METPDALQIGYTAAVSHSIVGEKHGYTYAKPSAIKQNFKGISLLKISTSLPTAFKFFTKFSVFGFI